MGGAAAAATAGLVRAGSNTTLPPRSPAQQRAALQRTSSDDRPNPLPSPASGFRGRTVSPAEDGCSRYERGCVDSCVQSPCAVLSSPQPGQCALVHSCWRDLRCRFTL